MIIGNELSSASRPSATIMCCPSLWCWTLKWGAYLGGPHRGVFANLYFILYHYRYIQKRWQAGFRNNGERRSCVFLACTLFTEGPLKAPGTGSGVLNSTPGCFVSVICGQNPTYLAATLSACFRQKVRRSANHIQTLPVSVEWSQNQHSVSGHEDRMRGRLKQGTHADKTTWSQTITTDRAGFKTVTQSFGSQKRRHHGGGKVWYVVTLTQKNQEPE